MPDDTAPQRFRVPRDDRSILAIPRLETAPRLVDQNRQLFAQTSCSLHDRRLADLRAASRLAALTIARDYTASLVQADLPESTSESLVVSGHQPELFHVGVWAKNFTLSGVARRSQSIAVNLVIDNDTLNGTSLRVPVGSRESMRIEHVLFDTPQPTQPWEEATIRDRDQFRKFGAYVRDRIRESWSFDPLIGTAWEAAVRQMQVSNRLCDGLTALRSHVERSWGQTNLELPISRLCEAEPFLWFVAHLMMRLPELHSVYNETVAIYRKEHRLRNRRQPVPDLEISNGWLEAPFWIWRQGDFQRGRLFARQVDSVCELRDEKDVIARLPLAGNGSLNPVVASLSELSGRGFRLRPRALTTTLFARVCLADLFVHGIGGAKYDWMTDRLCERLFGLIAPQFLTVSATLYLPLGTPFSTSEAELRDINHRIRDLAYNPDRHLNDRPAATDLGCRKKEMLASAKVLRTPRIRYAARLRPDQHRRLEAIRSELRSHVATVRAEYEAARATIRSRLSANSSIRNREFSFVLYPEEQVKEFLLPLAES